MYVYIRVCVRARIFNSKTKQFDCKINYKLDKRFIWFHHTTLKTSSEGKESSREVHVRPRVMSLQQKDTNYLTSSVSLSKLPIYSGPYFCCPFTLGLISPTRKILGVGLDFFLSFHLSEKFCDSINFAVFLVGGAAPHSTWDLSSLTRNPD